MKNLIFLAAVGSAALAPVAGLAADDRTGHSASPAQEVFTPDEVVTLGAVAVGGKRIAFHAHAGTLIVHPKGWDDTSALDAKASKKTEGEPEAVASMFYAAYFKDV